MHAFRRKTTKPAAVITDAIRVVVVCLTSRTPIPDLTDQALNVLDERGLPTNGLLVPHFTTNTRHRRELIDYRRATTSGGPKRLLDLTTMRNRAAAIAAAQWTQWEQVVKGTRPANPYWAYVEKHEYDPRAYPMAQARSDYWAQPRVMAMAAHNSVPSMTWPLPVSALEAFQSGPSTYTNLAWLAAVPGDALILPTGQLLSPLGYRLADQLQFLTAARSRLDQLGPDTRLVAVASPS